MSSRELLIGCSAAAGVLLLVRELRLLRSAVANHKGDKDDDDEGETTGARRSSGRLQRTLSFTGIGGEDVPQGEMTKAGIGRMRAIGSVLARLPRTEHNRLVAAASRRAAPLTQWGPVLAAYPEVVAARLQSLQTGDLVLTSTRVGSWVGNTVQVLTDSTWNHVAIVVRGRITPEQEEDVHDVSYRDLPAAMIRRPSTLKKQYQKRTPWHFEVDDAGAPHLFEASWQGVHIYPASLDDDGVEDGTIHDRLFVDPAYDEYSTIAVRALQGLERTPAMLRELERWIASTRGTAFEANAPLHNLFSDMSEGVASMHCAELTTETLKVLGIVDTDFVGGTAPPCVYADAPFGAIKLRRGAYGPLEIIKAEDEQLHHLEGVEFQPPENATKAAAPHK